MNFVNYYYEEGIGYFPNQEEINRTKATIDYLLDSGFTGQILIYLLEVCPKSRELIPEDIPDVAWDNSLIERSKFYYHSELKLVSPPPVLNEDLELVSTVPFYQEIKIRYTLQDLLQYTYSKLDIDLQLRNEKKDIGAITYLLNQYRGIDVIEPLDFVLKLIDLAEDADEEIINILHVANYADRAIKEFRRLVPNAIHSNINKIVWRNYNAK